MNLIFEVKYEKYFGCSTIFYFTFFCFTFLGIAKMNTIYDLNLKLTDMDKKTNNLSDYKGKVLLIVNVASKCGFTP